IRVPDIGSAGKARVIEVLVQAGDTVSAEQSLITLESDKASMEIPSPAAGVVESIAVQLDAEVGTGDLILTLKVEGAAPAQETPPTAAPQPAKAPAAPAEKPAPAPATPAAGDPHIDSIAPLVEKPAKPAAQVHAGPAVRQLAREFGIDLARVTATGPHGRVLKEDVQGYVKAMMQQTQAAPSGAAGGAG